MDDFIQKEVKNELTYDVLRVISEPLDSEVNFKAKIVRSLYDNLSTNHFEFASYEHTSDRDNPLLLCNTVAMNVQEVFWDDSWVNTYYDTCVYNPNHRPIFLQSQKNVFKVTDFMRFSEYKENVNFKELMEPHGYYYSCVAFMKNQKDLMGQIAFMRRKEEGDFSQDEIEKIESITPFIRNRLLDYKNMQNANVHRDLFYELISENRFASILLDCNYRIISSNHAAEEMCGNIVQQQDLSEFALQNVVDTVLMHRNGNRNYFKIIGRDQKEFYISIKPYRIPYPKHLETVYLMYISREGFVEDAKTPAMQTGAEASNLTGRQIEIVKLIAEGKTNGEIAKELLISENTVRKHVENIRTQLGVSNRIAILGKLNML